MRFRFTDPDDVAAFGDGWWVWDERAVTRLRARELIVLEETIGMSLVLAINLAREDSAAGDLAVTWIAVHLAGHPVKWADYNPAVLAVDWERVPEEPAPDPLDSGAAPPTEASPSSAEPAAESATS